jgi:hypothetical protein
VGAWAQGGWASGDVEGSGLSGGMRAEKTNKRGG